MNHTKRRIVLTTLGSLGDLHPMMSLALALRARGHEVALATSEFYRDRIERAGLAFNAIRPPFSPDNAQIVQQAMDSRKGPEYLIRTLLLPHLGDMYADVMAATDGADFLVAGEIVFAAPLVAEKRRLPWAAAILAPFSFFSAYDPAVLPIVPFAEALTGAPVVVQQILLRAAKQLTRKWGAPIDTLRSTLGLRASAQPLFSDRFSPFLNLALFSDVLGAAQPDWPANTVQTGFVFYDKPQDGAAANPRLEAFLEAGPPPVVFTLGSAAVMDAGHFFEESAKAARQLGTRAVLLMGQNPPPAGSSSDLFACDYAPYSQVFPRASCVVHQGGVGTTAQALKAGVPQLVMPYAFDQPDNAARVVRIGAALSVSKRHYRAERVVRTLKQLMTVPKHKQRARDIARRVTAQNGVLLACEAIERALWKPAARRGGSPEVSARAVNLQDDV